MVKVKNAITYIVSKSLLLSIIINLFLLIFYISFYKIHYETLDDGALSSIISGFYGENDAHAIFINYVLASFLKILYLVCQTVPWYGIFEIFVCFCSMVAINYFLFMTISSKSNIPLVIVFDFFVAYELYVNLQFTKTSGIASTSGILIILLFTLFKKRSVLGIILGFVLSIIGFCYRSNMFFISLLLCSTFGVLFLLRNKEFDKKDFFKRLVSCMLSLLVLFAFIGALFVIDKNQYSSSEWKYAQEKYKSLQIIADYNSYNFDKQKLENNGVNLDDIDLQMLKRWMFGDDEVFPLDTLKKISLSMCDNGSSFKNFVKQMVVNLVKYPYAMTFKHIPFLPYIPFSIFFVYLLILFIGNVRKLKLRNFLTITYLVITIIVEYAYMYSLGRVFLNRIDCVIWFTATIPVIMLTGANLKKSTKNNVINIVFFVLMFAVSQLLFYPQYGRSNYSFSTNKQAILEEINNDKEHFYFMTVISEHVSEILGYNPFENISPLNGENFSSVGGFWPSEITLRKKCNMNNPFSDVVNNDSVYWIDENIDETIAYINKHYDKNANAIFVKQVADCKIYKIVS